MKKHKVELTIVEHDNGLWTVDIPTDQLGPVRQIEVQSNKGHCFVNIAFGDLHDYLGNPAHDQGDVIRLVDHNNYDGDGTE